MIAGERSDSEIWRSFKNGSEEAFRSMYDAHYNALYGYGLRLCGDPELVKDALHDLFIKLWNNKSNLADVRNIKSYLFVSIRGIIFNLISRSKKILLREEDREHPFLIDFSPEVAHIVKETEKNLVIQMKKALDQLPERQKEILYLKFYQELPYEDIADIMRITIKGAYKLHARALLGLKKLITCLFFCYSVAVSFH